MPNDTVSPDEFFSGNATTTEEQPIVSAEEFLGTGEAKPPVAIPAISEEHHGAFLKNFGDAVYGEMLNSAIRLGGATEGGLSSFYNVIGAITGLNSFKKYREAMGVDQQYSKQAKEAAPGRNIFEDQYFGLIDAIGGIASTIPVDVMTGGATKAALAGRILPAMEAMLTKIPNFALGSGWRGMVEGVQRAGSLPEAVVGGIAGVGENVAWNSLFAQSGTGLRGIGKMASLGLSQSFYNAAKEGRMPTVEEMTDSTTQAAMLGVVFTALPHLAEGSQVAEEKAALAGYAKKTADISDPVAITKITYDLLTDPKIREDTRLALAQPFLDLLDARGDIAPMEFKLGQWKDPSKLRMFMWTMERTIEKVDKASAPEVQAETTEKIKENETFHKRWQTDLNNLIQQKELVPKGITPNSEASKYMMIYGEGRMTEAKLQKARPNDWGEIEQGAAFCRKVLGLS